LTSCPSLIWKAYAPLARVAGAVHAKEPPEPSAVMTATVWRLLAGPFLSVIVTGWSVLAMLFGVGGEVVAYAGVIGLPCESVCLAGDDCGRSGGELDGCPGW
jgi:hypothetical protein